jgi:cell division protein FtsN
VFRKAPRGATQRPATPEVKTSLIPAWLWLIFGTLFGLSIAVLLYLWQPWQPAQRDPVATTTPQPVSEQKPQPDQQGDYAFYELLPKQQVTPVPQQALPASTTPAQPLPDPNAAVTVDAQGRQNTNNPDPAGIVVEAREPIYILQINSYDNPDEADRQRADVLLVGLSADVRQTTTSDGTVWYRVVSGPYMSRAEALSAQRMLQDSGIDALVVEQP